MYSLYKGGPGILPRKILETPSRPSFMMATYQATRGHPLKLFKRRSRVNLRANSFNVQVVGWPASSIGSGEGFYISELQTSVRAGSTAARVNLFGHVC